MDKNLLLKIHLYTRLLRDANPDLISLTRVHPCLASTNISQIVSGLPQPHSLQFLLIYWFLNYLNYDFINLSLELIMMVRSF